MDIRALCEAAKQAAPEMAAASTRQKNAALTAAAALLRSHLREILAANEADMAHADANGVPKTMLDRLKLDENRVEGMAKALEALVGLADPVGTGECWTRPNGLRIRCLRVPLGLVAMIYEARPNVTVDAGALCIKTGNAVVLRGGKEAIGTSRVLAGLLGDALEEAGLPRAAVGFVDDPTRDSTMALMEMRGVVDVLIPRGGRGLIRSVVEHAKVPVIETGAGNCHLYVDSEADLSMALQVAVNAKTSRPSVCNAIETLLVHESVAEAFLPAFYAATRSWNLEIRGDDRTRQILPEASAAEEEDWEREYNDYILAVRVVPSLEEAVRHIAQYGTGHSEAIITESYAHATEFQLRVDAAAVYVNASTRFTDGGEFGFGAEIGISTQKLHTRGPMGLKELTTTKYLIDGEGQIR